MRQIAEDKLKLIEELKHNPIVLVACKKQNLAPSTFYRWKSSDKRFAKKINKAINYGRETVSDVAEAHLISSVKKGEMRSVFYWLKVFRHPYKKMDKTTIEINPKSDMAKKTIQSYPKIEEYLEKISTKFLSDSHIENLLRHELYQRGYTIEMVDTILREHPEYKEL